MTALRATTTRQKPALLCEIYYSYFMRYALDTPPPLPEQKHNAELACSRHGSFCLHTYSYRTTSDCDLCWKFPPRSHVYTLSQCTQLQTACSLTFQTNPISFSIQQLILTAYKLIKLCRRCHIDIVSFTLKEGNISLSNCKMFVCESIIHGI